MKTDTVKGFQDFTGSEALKRVKVRKIIEKVFLSYGFEPAETPIIEYEEFVRGDNENDEAVSDIFKLEDKGKRKLALRYELTFPLKRIAKNKKLPYKRYSIGDVFRDEPVSSNRFRQFTQCDVDIIGSGVKEEAEILGTIKTIGEDLGIKLIIYINNRKLLNEILERQGINKKDFEAVIREIDKIDKQSESSVKNQLKKYNAEKILSILKKPEKYFEKYESYSEIKELVKVCKNYGMNIVFKPSLARGLSYYNGTVFEARIKDDKNSVFGGGAYKINGIQAFGYGSGLERLTKLAKVEIENIDFLIISINRDKESIKLASDLRKKGEQVVLMYDKVTKALDYANSKNIQKVIIAGEKEKPKFLLKDMKSGKEKLVSVKELV